MKERYDSIHVVPKRLAIIFGKLLGFLILGALVLTTCEVLRAAEIELDHIEPVSVVPCTEPCPNDSFCYNGTCLFPEDDHDGDSFSPFHGDCDDTNIAIHPNAVEIPNNGVDENCDNRDFVKPVAPSSFSYDVDNDGDGYSANQGDCHDLEVNVFPGAPERCDIYDNDCDGNANEGCERRRDLTTRIFDRSVGGMNHHIFCAATKIKSGGTLSCYDPWY